MFVNMNCSENRIILIFYLFCSLTKKESNSSEIEFIFNFLYNDKIEVKSFPFILKYLVKNFFLNQPAFPNSFSALSLFLR